jgi:hypothetical protein
VNRLNRMQAFVGRASVAALGGIGGAMLARWHLPNAYIAGFLLAAIAGVVALAIRSGLVPDRPIASPVQEPPPKKAEAAGA